MKEYIGKTVLMTTSNWFYGKDGKQYRAAFGTLKAVHEAGKTLGFIPNRAHADRFIEVGSMIIMGCQVMYLQQVDDVSFESCEDYSTEGGHKTYIRPTHIYKVD